MRRETKTMRAGGSLGDGESVDLEHGNHCHLWQMAEA